MSYQSLARQAQDPALMARIVACVQQEAWNNAARATDAFAVDVRTHRTAIEPYFGYAVATITEAAYESALAASNDNPGGDPAVITDAAILAAVQNRWPATWPPAGGIGP